jgi:hypothetical protein
MSAWEDRPRLAVEVNGGPENGQGVQLGSQVRIRHADGDAEFYVVPPEEADAVADRVSARSLLGPNSSADVDDDLRTSLTAAQIPDGVACLRQRVLAVDRGTHLSGFGELGERLQVLLGDVG